MDEALRQTILDTLHKHGRATTYGALSGLIGGGPRNAMKSAPQSEACSWVVSAARKRPTNYPEHRLDPRLPDSVERNGVLDDTKDLAEWLSAVGVEV